MNKHLRTATAVLATALALTACGGSGSDTAGSPGSNTSTQAAKGNDADIAFLVGMKPHHEQAVEMSEIVLAADPPADVAAIATQIKNAQDPEIEQMTTMLEALGEKVETTSHSGGHSAGMAGHGGMMSDDEMEALMDAKGKEAARLYLEGMVRHHQGAIDASDIEIADGIYGPAIELARKIKAAQTTEITTMTALLTSL